MLVMCSLLFYVPSPFNSIFTTKLLFQLFQKYCTFSGMDYTITSVQVFLVDGPELELCDGNFHAQKVGLISAKTL